MASINPGVFTQWTLRSQETIQGQIFSVTQKQILQNERYGIAQQLLNLDYDPTNPTQFLLDQSFLKGQLSLVTLLLDRSDESEAVLRKLPPHS